MSLEMKKVRYSSRYGYSFEWHEPGSVRLSYKEALFFYTAFHHDLSGDELAQHFSEDEQVAIYRYQKLMMQKFIDTWLDTDDEQLSDQSLQREIQKQIKNRLNALEKGFVTYRQDLLGWPDIKETKRRDKPSPPDWD